MSVITARVATPNGGKYVRQLCKHWSHKLPVNLDGDTGAVTFPTAVATMAGDESGITVRIEGGGSDDVERLTSVVAKHIDRFAFREAPLVYDWVWLES